MLYNDTADALAKDKIIAEIDAITAKYAAEYPSLKFDAGRLSYDSLDTFACSFLIEFKNIQIPD
jgi:hypothetical protein